MITHLSRGIPNTRFVVFVAALYAFCLSAGALIPASSLLISGAPYVKLALVPFAQWFLIDGAKHRYSEDTYSTIKMASTFFYMGLIAQTIISAFF